MPAICAICARVLPSGIRTLTTGAGGSGAAGLGERECSTSTIATATTPRASTAAARAISERRRRGGGGGGPKLAARRAGVIGGGGGGGGGAAAPASVPARLVLVLGWAAAAARPAPAAQPAAAGCAGAHAPGGRARAPALCVRALMIFRRETRSATLTRLGGEPALQQMGRRPRVLVCLEARSGRLHPLRHARGEALVVHLHGNLAPQGLRELLGERPRLARLRGVASVERERKADDHDLDLARAHELPQPREPTLRRGTLDGLQWRDDRAGGVTERAPAARAAVV